MLTRTRTVKSDAEQNAYYRPFLKWAGNKFRIIDRVRQQLPAGKRLIEPFVGSAAVFLNTDYENYLLSDTNPDLVNLYTLLRDQGDSFINDARKMFNDKHNQEQKYYQLRDKFNQSDDIYQRALLFVYLNRHGYNGLCRYNAKGGFNVPFGRYQRPYFPEQEMRYFAEKAQRCDFRVASFEHIINQAQTGDVIYCDPPYVPLSTSANFTSYSSGGFSLESQQQLADLAVNAANKGIPVLISNHNTAFTRKAYRAAYSIKKFQVQRYISCNGAKRESAGELLALFS